ncbi:MAG: hypothetical protein LBO74_16370, partial [Candidatus Symbiothrix sp.]|nr:hypothetical protein [Candidatus Symbiothrix sp.]
MKKRRTFLGVALCAALLLFQPSVLLAQVHIGDTDANAKGGSLLDLTSQTAKLGLLPLRVNIDNINKIPSDFSERGEEGPAADLRGLIVFNINPTLAGGNGEGLYVWDGMKWSKVF